MHTYIINGKFMSDRMQGIVRYVREMLNSLDIALDGKKDIQIKLVIPQKAIEVPQFKNIKVIKIGKRKGLLWEQLDLAGYIRKSNECTLINFCNVAPFFVRPGITTVHDIMYKTFPANYQSLRNKISRLWHCLQYKYVFSHEKLILTVSDFSKKEIEKNYPRAKGKVWVIPNGWQHVLKYTESKDWQERYPFLKPKEYYFSLATLAPNKNVNWTIEVAKRNPNRIFAIGGKVYGSQYENLPDNIHLLGFISDEDSCSLIKNCKVFLYPSLYEGFGIPPLEALALGATVASSNSTSLPEVLGSSAYYFDPENYEINLDEIFNVNRDKSALEKYGWNKSAYKLVSILERLE